MKKLIALLLVLVFSFSLIAAEPVKKETSATPTIATAAPAPELPVCAAKALKACKKHKKNVEKKFKCTCPVSEKK